jgi:hypothetical protein
MEAKYAGLQKPQRSATSATLIGRLEFFEVDAAQECVLGIHVGWRSAAIETSGTTFAWIPAKFTMIPAVFLIFSAGATATGRNHLRPRIQE